MIRELGFSGIWNINPPIISTLLIFSILLIYCLLERAWTFLSTAAWDQEFWNRLKTNIQSGRYHDARVMCENSKNVYARVFCTALSNTHLNRVDNEDMVHIEQENQLENLRKKLGLFATFSFISPLVGLLGTVTGIMQAFSDLGRSGSGGANIVAAGISEALVSTAGGIIVAVPAALLYNYFTFRLRSINIRMTNFSHELIIQIYGGEDVGEKPVQPKGTDIRAKAVH